MDLKNLVVVIAVAEDVADRRHRSLQAEVSQELQGKHLAQTNLLSRSPTLVDNPKTCGRCPRCRVRSPRLSAAVKGVAVRLPARHR